jgi:hypothetical protein
MATCPAGLLCGKCDDWVRKLAVAESQMRKSNASANNLTTARMGEVRRADTFRILASRP